MSFFDFLPICVCVVGGYMMIRLRCFFIFRPTAVFRELKNSIREKGAKSSLCLALAGTLGVGNIVGVGVGIIVGGAGSILWLVISSLFATVLKYSEATISSDMSETMGSGMIFPLRKSFKKIGFSLSIIYAAAALLLSLTMGGALQSVGASRALTTAFSLSERGIMLAFALISIVVLMIFKSKIKWLTMRIIPISTLCYIAFSVAIISVNISKLPEIICLIFKSAFNPTAFLGGGVGAFSSLPLREGFSRGLLSNEAGAGTSSLSHSEAIVTPTGAGTLGMCEVFFDTVLLCPMTALVILSSVPDISFYNSGGELVIAAFENSLGGTFAYAVSVCILLFALSTVACWYYYGRVCAERLKISGSIYTAVFFLSLFILPDFGELVLVKISDALLMILSFLTGLVLIKNSDRIVYLSELSGLL